MAMWKQFANRIRYLLRPRSRFDDELQQEIAFHLESRAAELEQSGLSPVEALRQARREFGSMAEASEETRAAWQFRWLEEIVADLRYAARTFRRSPVFTLTAVLSLALGIGANAAIFSLVKAVLLGDLGLRDPERIVSFHQGGGAVRLSWPDYVDYSEQAHAFEDIAGSYLAPASFGFSAEPERLWGELVTTNFFGALGAEPRLGRGFTITDHNANVVVISDALWKSKFGEDAQIVGKTVLVGNANHTIVGVAPPGFYGNFRGLRCDFWVPLDLYPRLVPALLMQGKPEEHRNYRWLFTDARLKPGVSRAEAQASLNVVSERLDRAYPRQGQKRNLRLVAEGTLAEAAKEVNALLAILMVVVGLVLLIACANVANLLLARGAARQREFGVRLAIGAGRARVVRQLLTESLLLSFMGAALGLAIAAASTRAMNGFQGAFPIRASLDLTVDWRVTAFTAALSVFTAVLFGLLPALRSTRLNLISMLHGDVFAGVRRFGLKNALVVLQVAVSLALLAAAALFLRSLQYASAIPLGFDADRVLLMSFDPRATGYSNERAEALFRDVRQRVQALPNVESAGLAEILPLTLGPHAAGVSRPGQTQRAFAADIYGVSPQYFRTLGIELVRGSEFESQSQAAGNRKARTPAIINEAIARRLFGNEDPVGQTVAMEGMAHEVVGLARDTKSSSLSDENRPQIYLSLEQEYGKFWGLFGVVLAVKTRGNPGDLVGLVRQQLRDLEPAMAVYNVQTMQEHVDSALLIPRFCASLFGVFGGVGLLLASVGLYGLLSYSVRRRTKEIGVRMALGASRFDVLYLVGRQGLALVSAGLVLGLVLAVAGSRVLGAFLYGVGPHDAAAFLGVCLVLLAVAFIAIVVPARRAARLNAFQSIRYE